MREPAIPVAVARARGELRDDVTYCVEDGRGIEEGLRHALTVPHGTRLGVPVSGGEHGPRADGYVPDMSDTSSRPDSPSADEASLGELVGRLSEQSSRLVRDEIALARAELQASVKHAGVGAGLFGGAGLIALLGVVTLVGAAVAALDLVLALWLAALLVAVALFAVAGVAALVGRRQVSQVGPPERTIENVRRDVAEVKGDRS